MTSFRFMQQRPFSEGLQPLHKSRPANKTCLRWRTTASSSSALSTNDRSGLPRGSGMGTELTYGLIRRGSAFSLEEPAAPNVSIFALTDGSRLISVTHWNCRTGCNQRSAYRPRSLYRCRWLSRGFQPSSFTSSAFLPLAVVCISASVCHSSSSILSCSLSGGYFSSTLYDAFPF